MVLPEGDSGRFRAAAGLPRGAGDQVSCRPSDDLGRSTPQQFLCLAAPLDDHYTVTVQNYRRNVAFHGNHPLHRHPASPSSYRRDLGVSQGTLSEAGEGLHQGAQEVVGCHGL